MPGNETPYILHPMICSCLVSYASEKELELYTWHAVFLNSFTTSTCVLWLVPPMALTSRLTEIFQTKAIDWKEYMEFGPTTLPRKLSPLPCTQANFESQMSVNKSNSGRCNGFPGSCLPLTLYGQNKKLYVKIDMCFCVRVLFE